jgi:hypothetical protein
VVEGTDCPTIVSSPDVEGRGILATGLEKAKNYNLQFDNEKYSIAK